MDLLSEVHILTFRVVSALNLCTWHPRDHGWIVGSSERTQLQNIEGKHWVSDQYQPYEVFYGQGSTPAWRQHPAERYLLKLHTNIGNTHRWPGHIDLYGGVRIRKGNKGKRE